MKISKRKLRFIISLFLLICGVFALYPYLSAHPQRQLRKSLSGLDRTAAVSVMNSLALGQALAAKARDLSSGKQGLSLLADKLERETQTLKKEILALPDNSTTLTESASAALKSLDERFSSILEKMAESEK